MIMVLMKERNPAIYSSVKYVGDHFLGIPSQCLLLKTVSPLKSMTASNILLKMNAKLGGANRQLKLEQSPQGLLGLLTEPSLVMGLDVSHPKPGDSRAPSVASVVAKTDRDLTKFNATIAVSKPDLEDIPYFRYAFEKRMFEFVKKTKKVPRHIFVFRDGVSESQYSDFPNIVIKGSELMLPGVVCGLIVAAAVAAASLAASLAPPGQLSHFPSERVVSGALLARTRVGPASTPEVANREVLRLRGGGKPAKKAKTTGEFVATVRLSPVPMGWTGNRLKKAINEEVLFFLSSHLGFVDVPNTRNVILVVLRRLNQ